MQSTDFILLQKAFIHVYIRFSSKYNQQISFLLQKAFIRLYISFSSKCNQQILFLLQKEKNVKEKPYFKSHLKKIKYSKLNK